MNVMIVVAGQDLGLDQDLIHEAAAAAVVVRVMDMPFMCNTPIVRCRLEMIAHLLLPLLEARRTKTQVIIVFLGRNGKNDQDQKGSVADCSRQ
jgi:hypothetical protein